MIDPQIWGSPDFNTLLVRTEQVASGMFFIGLFSLADDHGIIKFNPERLGLQILKGLYIQHKEDISKWVDELQNLSMIEKYTYSTDAEKVYLMLPGWFDVQKVPHPKLSEQPLPPKELLEMYPGYRDGLSHSIQIFLRENQTNIIKCMNFTFDYSRWLNIPSNISGRLFESTKQIKGNEIKGNKNISSEIQESVVKQTESGSSETASHAPLSSSPKGGKIGAIGTQVFSTEVTKLVDLFIKRRNQALANIMNPKMLSVDKSKYSKWCNSVRLQLEKDEDKPEDIRRVIEWVTTDDFWMKQCLSIRKFRQKKDDIRYFDKFMILMSETNTAPAERSPSERFVN